MREEDKVISIIISDRINATSAAKDVTNTMIRVDRRPARRHGVTGLSTYRLGREESGTRKSH